MVDAVGCVDSPLAQSNRMIVLMRTWMLPWFFPVGLIGALVLLTRGTFVLDLLAVAWSLVLVPGIAISILRRSPEGPERLQDLETNYWRIGSR